MKQNNPQTAPVQCQNLVPLPYRHVSVQPNPPKLPGLARQVLAYADYLPPLQLTSQFFDLTDLARQAPDAEAYLIPCRASGLNFDVPPPPGPGRRYATLLKCCLLEDHIEVEGSRAIGLPGSYSAANTCFKRCGQ